MQAIFKPKRGHVPMVGDMDRMRFSFKERWFFRNSWYAWRPVVVDFDARRIEFVRCGFFASLYLHFCASVSYVRCLEMAAQAAQAEDPGVATLTPKPQAQSVPPEATP